MSRSNTHSILIILLLGLTPSCLPQGNGGGGGGGVIIDGDTGNTGGSDLGDCVPACGSRTCGVDPVCGASCGACEGTCSPEGTCDQSSGEGAPQFVSLTTNVTTMNPDDTLVISAVVTDPDGVEDLLGGQLFDATGQASYGSFSANTPGSYELTLTWGQLDTVAQIDTPAGGTTRVMKATFFDQKGSSSSRDVNIQLQCNTTTDGICAGACVDFESDPRNCGACGNADPNGELPCIDGVLECPGGGALCNGECTDLLTDRYNCGTCGNDDDSGDRECVNGQLVCSDAGFEFCNNECVSPDDLDNDVNNCGTCGNDCQDAAQGIANLAEYGCFEAACYLLVLSDNGAPTNCNTICAQNGLRCDDSISGIPCSEDSTDLNKGCTIHSNTAEGCEILTPQARCSDGPTTPSAAQIQSTCGLDSVTFDLVQSGCDCTN